jgi:hypothetical protein
MPPSFTKLSATIAPHSIEVDDCCSLAIVKSDIDFFATYRLTFTQRKCFRPGVPPTGTYFFPDYSWLGNRRLPLGEFYSGGYF